MSVSRPVRCLLSNPHIPRMASRVRCRNFHTSLNLSERRRPRHPNIKAADMGLIDKKPAACELFKPYSEDEKALLAKKYTPEQIRAIEAGEDSIRPEDLKRQGVVRTDIGSISYLDDFRHYRNVIDKKPPDNAPIDPNARFMTYDELTQSFIDYRKKLEKENPPPGPDDAKWKFDSTRLNFMRADYESPRYMGTHGPIPSGPNLFAPAIPKKLELDGRPKTTEGGQAEEVSHEAKADLRDPEGVYNLVMRQTGLTITEIMNLKVKVLVRNFVANQTRLGKVRSLFCIAIAGNKNGQLGIGQAKGQEALNTMNLAKISAIRNMKPIPRYEERTIFGDVEAKVSGTIVKLMARPPGFGLRSQHLIFEMARAAGIHDLASRVPRSRNKMNTVKATYKALMKQRIPEEIARGRGRKLVDVRKVYYGGLV